jgi:succinate dehydrogenase / fumarate reductase cytochrome b subunit
MGRLMHLWRLTVIKKLVMALSGLILLLFVVGHLAGNLKIFLGPEVFNHYASGLREVGSPFLAYEQFVWLNRLVLLAAVGAHGLAALQLRKLSVEARGVAYERRENISFSRVSHTMFWGGITLALFIVYHLAHLTVGVAHVDFQTITVDGHTHADAYANVVNGFQPFWVVLIYCAGVIALGLHLYHGIWSACQTLGLNHPKYNAVRRQVALGVALLISLGYLSIPNAVMAGVVGY